MALRLDERRVGGRHYEVLRSPIGQWLAIDGQDQGAAFLDPGPGAVVPGLTDGPGPIPETTYLSAWLLAAAHRPAAHFTVLGLGSGAGVVALALEFPKARITVVESDPVVEELARGHFPLTAHVLALDRVAVVRADALDWLVGAEVDTLLLDLYPVSDALLTRLQTPEVALALARVGGAIWTNLAFNASHPAYRRVVAALDAAGRRPRHALTTVRAPPWFEIPRNWVVTDEAWDAAAVEAYTPWRHVHGGLSDEGRRAVAFLSASRQSVPDLPDR